MKLGIAQTIENDNTDTGISPDEGVEQLHVNSLDILFELRIFRELGVALLEKLRSHKYAL